ncbi:glycosyltransferase family 4 protein, partial [Verrucomicrobiales bacterium]|nr:glycosyltransferase family 4 protein [Verrucomicrobiales bacterium]
MDNRPARALYLTPGCFDKGGISRYCRYQIRALRELWGEDNVRVLSLLGEDEASFEAPLEIDWSGTGPNLGSKLGLTWNALRHALVWRPDVIHSAHLRFSGLSVRLAELIGARSVINAYGLEVWSSPPKDAMRCLKRCDAVISDCHFTGDYIESNSLHSGRPIEVIWDCVDLDLFRPGPTSPEVIQRYGIPDPAKYFNIMTLGRLAPEAMHKGYDRLLEAFVEISKRHPIARMIIAGRGRARGMLEELAVSLGVDGKVVFTGSVTEADLPLLYRSASVFSLVSDRGHGRGEGIPLTPLEAMACGVPILVGNHDGSQEAVYESKNGIVIDPMSRSAHVEALCDLIRNPGRRDEMAKNSVKVA